jgi:Conserved TM helix
MTLATILDRAGDSLGGYLPRLGGALLLLLVGLLLAALVRRALVKLLQAAKVDDLGEQWGVHEILDGLGLERSLSVLIARAVRIAIVVVVIFAALSLLGLEFLSDSLNAVILFLPRVFVALALLVAGIAIGQVVRRHVDRLAGQMDIPGPVGALAEALIIGVFAVTALAQLGIPPRCCCCSPRSSSARSRSRWRWPSGSAAATPRARSAPAAMSRARSTSATRSAWRATAGGSPRSRRPERCSRPTAGTACGSPTHSSSRRS